MPGSDQQDLQPMRLKHLETGIPSIPVDAMAPGVTPISTNPSASRGKSPGKLCTVRTGADERAGGTATT
jgi:hypothetical protein